MSNRTKTCEYCGKKYKGKQGLAQHMFWHKNDADHAPKQPKVEVHKVRSSVTGITSVTVTGTEGQVIINYGTRKV